MLNGHNIYLRLLERKDLRILYSLCNEEKVKKYNIVLKRTEESDKKESNLRKALSIINEKNVLVGFMTYKESSYYKDVYSIGITIGSRYWDRGYGQDSIKTLLKYLFDDLNAVRVELEVIQSNLRAMKCYKKCGFKEKAILGDKYYIDGEYSDIIIMSLLKNEMKI